MIELWLLLSFSTMMIWGAGQVASKVGTSGAGTGTMMFLVAVIEVPLYGSWYALLREDLPIDAYGATVALTAAILGIAGYILFFEAIAKGEVSIIGTICAAYPCVTVVAAILLLEERLSEVQMMGVCLILLGIVGLSVRKAEAKASYSRLGLVFAVGCFITWGLWGVAAKEAVGQIGDSNLVGFYAVVSPSVGLAYWRLKLRNHPERSIKLLPRRALLYGFGAVGSNGVGILLMTWALVDGPVSIVIALSGAYPLVTILLARAFLRERITFLQVLPLVALVAGIPLVSF